MRRQLIAQRARAIASSVGHLLAQLRDLAYRTLGVGRSPYAYVPTPGRPFGAYGMEQQAQIVEDAVRGSVAARAITGAGRLS